MTDLMKTILALTVSGTVLAGGLALLRRLLKNKLPQWLFYYLWLLVLLRLIVPVAVPLPEAWRPHQTEAMSVPVQQVTIEPGLSGAIQQAQNQLPPGTADQPWEIVVPSVTMPSTTPTQLPSSDPWHEQLWDFLCDHFLIIWLGGAVIHFLWFALSYLRFCHRLKETYSPLWEHEQALLNTLRNTQKVTACRSILASTPMLVGLVHPWIILPPEDITTRQLECILRHELTHLSRRDLLYKWFVVAATSLHWFNPFMPWLRREISRCCELSCDEQVVGSMDERQKQWYGETLLALASLRALPRAVPATTLCEEKQQLRERLLGIMKYRKATALILLLSCLLTILIAGCASVLGPQMPVEELPRASDYALWINAAQQDVFVRNWKVEYHDGTHVASTHMAPADYTGDEYVFRGRDLPELRARVEAWAFAELPLDRENCVLYYRMEADALESDAAGAREVMRFPLDGGTPEKLALSELDMTTYCGYVTVTDLRDQEHWLLVLTDDNRMPQLTQRPMPLTEERQAPILENIRAWAEQNIETQGTYELKYVHEPESAYGVGSQSILGWDSYLYNIHTDEIRLLDGTYPDSAELGHVQLVIREGESVRAFHTFHLTGGDPAKATSPFFALEQLAADYPKGKVTQLQWYKKHGQYLYIRVDFVSDGTGYCFEYTSINGLFNVREHERALQREQGMTIPVLVKSLQAVIHWQETQSSEHDRENYNLGTWAPSWLSNMMNYGDFAEFENIVVYDLATDEIALSEKPYTGSAEHGAFTLLHPAEEPRHWVYIVDDSGDNSLRAGMLAVVTEDAPLEYAHAHTVDDLGREVLMDMAMTVKKGTLVYLDAVEGANCELTVLAGDLPRVQGTLNARLLSTDMTQSNQVILQDTDCYDDAGGTVVDTRSGVAQIEQQTPHWLQVTLPGGAEPFWVRRVDLNWEWPIAVAQSPEAMSATDLKAYYMDFAMDWRVDFIPDFDWNSFSDTVSTQDFLMLTYYIHKNSLPEDGSMSAALIEQVMETHFGIENVQHESLFKTWNWDSKKGTYLPVSQGVAEEGLFDVVTFNAAERWEDGAPQTVYTLTMREYGYPFVYGTEQYSDLVNYAADKSAHYRDNMQFLLENKGGLLKKGEISSFEAMQQLILEGNTSGFTKGREIQLEYYMTGNGPRFLYKSEREFDFTPGEIYENTQYGYCLTLPACWGENYRLIKEDNSLRIDTVWGGTLCSVFRRDVTAFDEELIPVPYRVLGQNEQYVWLMYFASDVQYDPADAEQTTAYLNMYQDLWEVPFRILDSASDQQQGTPDEELIYEQRPDGSVGERFILLRRNGYMGLLDGAGNQLLAPETYQLDSIYLNTYEEVWPISLVVKDGLYGAIDYNGNLVIQPQWQAVMMYCYDRPDMVFLRDGYQWYGVRLSYDRYTDVFTYSGMQVSQPFEALHLIPELQVKTAAWLEQEFHRVYDPYYDIQELVISNWKESGKEATFYYTMTWLNYNRDPDTVPYIQEAKTKSQSSYETLYQDYLALKTGNYSFKIVWEGDTPTLYTDVSVKGEPEWERTEVQNFVLQ